MNSHLVRLFNTRIHEILSHYFYLCPDTLPTYLQTTTRDPSVGGDASTTTAAGPTAMTALNTGEQPVPNDLRGSELTFEETGYEKTFLFAENNTFIQMDGDLIQTFQLR